MPSLYEPFGSANEGLLAGTPVVARATGGLWVQVNSQTTCIAPTFYGALLAPTHSQLSTGILYREQYDEAKSATEWRKVFGADPYARRSLPLFESIVVAAHEALSASVLLCNDNEAYHTMVVHGLGEARKLSWSRAAGLYQKVYDRAVGRKVR